MWLNNDHIRIVQSVSNAENGRFMHKSCDQMIIQIIFIGVIYKIAFPGLIKYDIVMNFSFVFGSNNICYVPKWTDKCGLNHIVCRASITA